MPRHVDPDQRRREIADLAATLIARDGLERLSLRDVARAAGTSTTVVTHYFAGKRELLLHTYRVAAGRAAARLAAATEEGRDALDAFFDSVLPLDAERRQDWQIWYAFFGAAMTDADLAAEQRRRVHESRLYLARGLERRGANGDAPAAVARALLALVHGIASVAVIDPEDWPPDRQRALVDTTLARLGYAR
jgi:AcrR family transcriptional regulator